MCEPKKEGALRPLYLSASKIEMWAVLFSYPLAYLYVKTILIDPYGFQRWGRVVFTIAFMAGVDLWARAARRTPAKETSLWAVCWAALSVGMCLWGLQSDLTSWQHLAWHAMAVWFVLARCGILAEGFTGSLFFLDGLAGFLLLPFGGFFRRASAFWQAVRRRLNGRFKGRTVLVGAVTVCVTLLLCGTALGLLSAADANFARVTRLLENLLRCWDFSLVFSWGIYFALSLPVGAWLFGLVSGAVQSPQAPCPGSRFMQRLEPLRLLPAVTANIAVGALCGLYTLFFAVQLGSWLNADALHLTAPQASDFAVAGFWELFRILLLNFAVLAAVRFLGRTPLPKALAALFCFFGLAFAALAGAKLAVYVHLYAFTPRRVVAGWFLCVLAVWAILLAVRVFKAFPAARAGLAVLVISFTLLSCVDMNSRIANANIDRWAAGVDAELDTGIIYECGRPGDWDIDTDFDKMAQYTRRLAAADWFTGRSRQDIQDLYRLDLSGNEVCLPFDSGAELRLQFDKNICVKAEFVP